MYGMNSFSPYGYPQFGQQMGQMPPFSPQGMNPPMQQNGLQNAPQMGMEVVPVQTIQQVEQVGLQPGQRKMVMVQNEPVIAARSADNMGLVTTEYYRLEKFVPGTAAPMQTVDYITRQEFDEFVASLKGKGKKEASAE